MCHIQQIDTLDTGVQADVPRNATAEVPAIPEHRQRTLQDPGYSYNPYQDHDEDNAYHYRYDQSKALRTYLEVPDIPPKAQLDVLTASKEACCVGTPWPNHEPARGFDIKDMIDPNCLTDTSLTNMFLVQFRRDPDVLVIPVSVTKVLSSCAIITSSASWWTVDVPARPEESGMQTH